MNYPQDILNKITELKNALDNFHIPSDNHPHQFISSFSPIPHVEIRQQCTANTRRGPRCNNRTSDGLCWQHKRMTMSYYTADGTLIRQETNGNSRQVDNTNDIQNILNNNYYYGPNDPSDCCGICKEEYNDNYHEIQIKLPCGHKYCAPCIGEWFKVKRNCPVCRADVR